MAIYRQMYFELFNAVTDAMVELKNGQAWKAQDVLKKAQITCEEMYMEDEMELRILPIEPVDATNCPYCVRISAG